MPIFQTEVSILRFLRFFAANRWFNDLPTKEKWGIIGADMTNAIQERLQQLRNALLDLHKALVDSERVTYEQTMGSIKSPSQFLQLVTRDPWFAWLQPMSKLIVAMDEALDEKEPLTTVTVEALVNQTRLLLVTSEEGDGLSKHYFDALQRDPDVVFAHAEVVKVLGLRKKLV
jgi:hypothetical protein